MSDNSCQTKKYLITYVVGDTYNIQTHDIVEVDESGLVPMLDKYSDYYGWRTNRHIRVFEVSKEWHKWELQNLYDSSHTTKNGDEK